MQQWKPLSHFPEFSSPPLAERNPPSGQGCQLQPGEILAGMRNAHLGFIPLSPEHPGASQLARPMTTEHLTKKLYKKKKTRRKLFPPTLIIFRAVLEFPARGSHFNMVWVYMECLMDLNV